MTRLVLCEPFEDGPATVDFFTTLRFLFLFDHQAIAAIAADSSAPLAGLILVISAGIARNHAGHDLIRQPWRILTPVAASLLTAGVLFAFIQLRLWLNASPVVPWLSGAWSFLGVYWATAPLAWIYGVPYEWLLGLERAQRARLTALGIVALWRIVLIFHGLLVLLDQDVFAVTAILLFVESVMALYALFSFSSPRADANRPHVTSTLINAMGGIMLGPRTAADAEAGDWDLTKLSDTPPPFRSNERSIGVANIVAHISGYTAFVGLLLNFMISPHANSWQRLAGLVQFDATMSISGFSLTGAAGWALIAMFTLPAQRRKSHVERLMAVGRIPEAIRYLAAFPISDFPAAWEPPPRENFRGTPSMLGIMEALATQKPGGWVEASYAPRIRHYVGHAVWYWHYADDASRLCDVLERLQDGPALARLALIAIDRHEVNLAFCRTLHARSRDEGESPRVTRGRSRRPLNFHRLHNPGRQTMPS